MPTDLGTLPLGRTATATAVAERGAVRAVTTVLGVAKGINMSDIATVCTNRHQSGVTHRERIRSSGLFWPCR